MLRSFFLALGVTSVLTPAAALAADDDRADPIVVIGKKERYDAKRSATATKLDGDLKDVPQAVSVVTAGQMSDQAMRSMVDVLRAVPGASVANGEGHRDQILLRGQASTADFYVDGLRDDVQYYRGLYNLERVEVLKGPNALIFGRGGGGGIVNRVTKTAEDHAFAGGAIALDSFGAWSMGVDVNQLVARSVAARVNAVAEDFASFRDHVDGRRYGINPTLGVDLDGGARIDLSYEYDRDRRVVDRGIPSKDGRPLEGAQRTFFGDPDVNRTRLNAHVADLRASVPLSPAVEWRFKARYGHYDKAYRNAMASTEVKADGTVGMQAYRSGSVRDSWLGQSEVVVRARTGGLKHAIVAGIDAARQDSRSDRQQGFFDDNGGARQIFVPVGEADSLPRIVFRDDPSRRATLNDTRASAFGLYVQDQVKLGDRVELIGGLRRDWFTLDYHDLLGGERLSRTDRLWSPRLGVVLKASPALSFYASWSKSFLPQSGDQFSSLDVDTEALEPERFVNREIGAKWRVMPGLDATLAAYVLDRTNTRALDPVTGDTVLTGAERSKGIEASLTGAVAPRLSMALGAALQSAKITETTRSAPAGTWIASVPKFQASAWARYDVSKRVGLGLGVVHNSKRYASTSNVVVLPAFTRVDAAAFLSVTRDIQFQVNVENLFNLDYTALSHTDNNLTPGAPRTIRGSLKFSL